jgi:formiminotetrahydrofolate cyclodeaminase
MAAGFSGDRLADAASLRKRAEALRAKLAPLPREDGAAYAEVLRASALPKGRPDRRELVQRALSAASEVPMELARAAAEVTTLADDLAERGNPRLRGEVVTARLLAAAAVRAAAGLVEENLSDKSDPRIAEARALVAAVGHRAPGAVGSA